MERGPLPDILNNIKKCVYLWWATASREKNENEINWFTEENSPTMAGERLRVVSLKLFSVLYTFFEQLFVHPSFAEVPWTS